MKSKILNLRQLVSSLRAHKEVVDIYEEVDPSLELAEIHRRVSASSGPALFFHKVKNSSFPVVTNLFGSEKRVEIAFAHEPEKFVEELVHFATKDFPPSLKTLWKKRSLLRGLLKVGTRKKKYAPVTEEQFSEVDLHKIPMLKTWPLDGGHFITLPLVYTENPLGGGSNLGMYRIQRYNADEAGLHFQIAKGGGFHYHQAEQLGQNFPVSIFIGGPPALILSAIAPLPENVPELILCSLLQGKKVDMTSCGSHPHPLIGECEFALLGEAKPHRRHPEGPFGDHYGYYSWTHDFPVFECKKITHRKDAIYPATVVGKPMQEDFYIGNYLQKLLSPLFPVVMPGVKDLWSYGETGFHSLSAAVVRERFYRESMASAFRILGEGQLMLTKCLFLTDKPVCLQNFKEVLTTLLERIRPETDLFIFANLSLDTLDYTGPSLNKGSRAVFLGIGEQVRTLPTSYSGGCPDPLTAVEVFSPGCLVLEAPAFTKWQEYKHLLAYKGFKEWPLLILVDSVAKTCKSVTSFLWTVFTRFEPAADIHVETQGVFRHHLTYSLPILIDARMKPSYPPEVLCDEKTATHVEKNWNRYFPSGMEMGDSHQAHVS